MDTNGYKHNASHYKVIEISTVTEETIENVLNTWVSKGWQFDQIQFVVREASRRPSMAFLLFTQPVRSNEAASYSKEIISPENDADDSNQSATDNDEGEIRWS